MSPFVRLAAAFVLALLLPSPASAQFDSVGSLQLQTSARSAEAQQHFLRGLAILHSFGWEQAIEQFQAAQELEPDFASPIHAPLTLSAARRYAEITPAVFSGSCRPFVAVPSSDLGLSVWSHAIACTVLLSQAHILVETFNGS